MKLLTILKYAAAIAAAPFLLVIGSVALAVALAAVFFLGPFFELVDASDEQLIQDGIVPASRRYDADFVERVRAEAEGRAA